MRNGRLLVLMLFCAGFMRSAEAMPVGQCSAMMLSQAAKSCCPTVKPSCCGSSSCDCKIKLPANYPLDSVRSERTQIFSQEFDLFSEANLVLIPTLKISGVADESPPEEDPLYQLYSVYRI